MSELEDQPHSAQHPREVVNEQDILGDVFLEGTVLVSGKEEQLKLMPKGLSLAAQAKGSKGKTFSLAWRDVLSSVRDKKSSGDQQSASFTLHYIHHQSKYTLICKTLKITSKDGHGGQFINAINENCQKVPGRPKNVFVVVNPIGGAKQGRQIYENTVAPLFELAGIHATVKFTERSKHAVEIGEQQDFTGYDSIIVVGGDGLYQEVLLGVTLQTQKKAGVDYNNPDARFAKPDITFGVIPAGTGNSISRFCTGSFDKLTPVLTIIRGESDKSQVLTVHSDSKFVTLSGALFGYGTSADIMKETEGKRWMGRARYPYVIAGYLFKKDRKFNCSVECRFADNQKSHEGESNSSGGAGAAGAEAEWVPLTGKNNGPLCGLYCIVCERIKSGSKYFVTPYGKCIDLFVDFGCGMVSFWTAFFKYLNGRNVMPENVPAKLELITRITGFRIKILSDETEAGGNISAARAKAKELEHYLNVDGEVVRVDKPDIDLRIHPEFVSIYGHLKRISDDAETQ